MIVCPVGAEVKTKTEKFPDNAETSSTREEKLRNKEQPIGEAPADDVSHLFLRDFEVLLKPREIRISIGFNYNTDENQRSFRKNRNRSIFLPLIV